jgi:Tfp pilus assembly protein PilF
LLQQPDFDRKNEAYLYLGISYLLSDQEEMALRSFDSVDRDSKALYYGSQWYAALTYLKLNEKEKALKALEALENSRTYRIKAAELSSAISGL